MPKIPFVQIDAFASKTFEGNQACVMPLEAFLPDESLQKIAAENNVAETAFIVPDGEARWQLRWFTPATEVPLCGHATLATGHYLYTHGGFTGEQITFQTRQSGELYVRQLADGQIEMDFPAQHFESVPVNADIADAFGAKPIKAYTGPCYVLLFETAEQVKALTPDLGRLKSLGTSDGAWGVGNFGCLALDGEGVDVTSRFFAPGSGIPEDPATGSWHCMVSPLVNALNGAVTLKCYQAYPGRGAFVETELQGERVKLRGQCTTVIDGTFHL